MVDVPGDLAPARAAPEQIQRVLFNLIQNAIRHTPADGSVTVRAPSAAATASRSRSPTRASGSPTADRDRVFDAFFQGGDGAARTNGATGLGLAISRAIVEAHGGRIWLEPSTAGTSVRFTLPAS